MALFALADLTIFLIIDKVNVAQSYTANTHTKVDIHHTLHDIDTYSLIGYIKYIYANYIAT